MSAEKETLTSDLSLYAPELKDGKHKSYVEIEITRDRVTVFERLDSLEADKLVEIAARYGLRLKRELRSLCG